VTAPTVLDSAVLALLQGEPGADEVEPLLDGALMSCVNLSEVLQKAEQHGVQTDGLEYDLEALGVEFRDFDLSSARSTAEAWAPGSELSLGDRACLALVGQVGGIAVTTDARWAGAGLEVNLRVLR
jgi:PIN domain nuclease of toxin-antitoxin system